MCNIERYHTSLLLLKNTNSLLYLYNDAIRGEAVDSALSHLNHNTVII